MQFTEDTLTSGCRVGQQWGMQFASAIVAMSVALAVTSQCGGRDSAMWQWQCRPRAATEMHATDTLMISPHVTDTLMISPHATDTLMIPLMPLIPP